MLIKYPCPENNISCHPVPILLTQGKWKIELWGAGTTNGGGYTSGILRIRKQKTFFAFIGGQEMPPGPKIGYGGYNGGGNSTVIGLFNKYYRQSGGSGSTDIRITENDVNSRIMVAGGSGGASCYSAYPGGYGGGLTGGDGTYDSKYSGSIVGKGGTQENGGQGKMSGSLLIGGSNTPSSGTDCAGAGGGGYYGGGSGYHVEGTGSGGGGSSYISGYKGCKIHKSNIFFTDAVMIPGNNLMPQPDLTNKVGYIGQGAVRITFLSFIYTSKYNALKTTNFILSLIFLSS